MRIAINETQKCKICGGCGFFYNRHKEKINCPECKGKGEIQFKIYKDKVYAHTNSEIDLFFKWNKKIKKGYTTYSDKGYFFCKFLDADSLI